MQRRLIGLLVVLCLIIGTSAVSHAQDANLLRDGGMEGSYSPRGRADLNIPTDWSIWSAELPRSENWMNLPPVAFPHRGPDPSPRSGVQALNLNKGFATFTAAIYQQVAVPEGAAVTASAFAYLRTCDIPDGVDTCRSNPDAGAFTRIGIDPNGGTNPLDTDVVWSVNMSPHESWVQMTLNTTATGGTVTLFLYATQTWPRELNQVYWDDAFLSAGTDGAAPIAPTAALEVGFVQPQNQREDGSLVHVVQAGDTIDSIAVAYGLTRAEVLALNPNLASARFIQIGQEIVIQAPQTPTPTIAPTLDLSLPTLDPSLLTAVAAAAVGASVESTVEVTDEATEVTATASPTGTPTPTPSPTEEITEAVVEPTVEPSTEPTREPTSPVPTNPASAILSAPPAPIVSAANGVVFPINPADESASVCVMMFDDANQNRLQDADEGLVTGGRIVLSLDGAEVAQHITGDLDPTCIDGLTSAQYLANAEPPSGYGLTTAGQLNVRTTGGAQIGIAFGAAAGLQPVVAPPPDNGAAITDVVAETNAPEGVPLRENIGLIVFGAAAFVLVVGMGATLLLRRR